MQKTHSYEFSIPIPTSYFRFYYCGTQCPCCQDDAWIPSVVLHSCTKSASSGRRNCDESWVSLITTPSSRSQPRPAWRSFTHSTQSMLLQTNTWHTLTVTWPRKQQKSEKASATFLNKIQSKYQDERQRETSLINGSLSRTTWVSRYQKGKTDLDFTEARDSEWQWHQLGHMQVCTSLQTDNHASTPPLSFLQAGCPSCRPTNSVKTLKALISLVHWNHKSLGTVVLTKNCTFSDQ